MRYVRKNRMMLLVATLVLGMAMSLIESESTRGSSGTSAAANLNVVWLDTSCGRMLG